MSKLPAMTASINADTKNRRVQVVIEHDHAQSFARAVEPRGKKEFKRWLSENIVFGAPVYEHKTTILGGPYVRDSKDRCVSVLSFRY